jgi:hypothetical protein
LQLQLNQTGRWQTGLRISWSRKQKEGEFDSNNNISQLQQQTAPTQGIYTAILKMLARINHLHDCMLIAMIIDPFCGFTDSSEQ